MRSDIDPRSPTVTLCVCVIPFPLSEFIISYFQRLPKCRLKALTELANKKKLQIRKCLLIFKLK